MKNFNKDRFLSYARYDLVANKAFYRKAALIILLTAAGSTIINVVTKAGILQGSSYADYHDYGYIQLLSSLTMIGYIIGITTTMDILAGCWGHNLRTKQGRITMLTLPVSSLEKYVWHTGLMVVGGFIFLMLTLVLVELLNVTLTACVTGHWFWGNAALLATLHTAESVIAMSGADPQVFYSAWWVTIMMWGGLLLARHMLFALSNAVLYKHNVLIMYGVLILLSGIGNITMISGFYRIADSFNDILYGTDGGAGYSSYMMSTAAIAVAGIGVAALLWWVGYKLFERAELCNKWNK